MCTPSVSNVIYHKFSHGTVTYMLNVENINVMLELANIAFTEREKIHSLMISLKLLLPSYRKYFTFIPILSNLDIFLITCKLFCKF